MIFIKAPESESEASRAGSKHGAICIPKELKTTVDVVEIEGADDLSHRCQNRDAIDEFFCKRQLI